jgi:hypothetical protein
MALQHLRASTANKRPTPGAMADGQLAMNTNLASPGLFFKDSNGDLVKVGPVHVGTTAPNATPASGGQAGNSKGEQWLDTSGANPVFKIWDGSNWISEAGEFVNASGDTMTGALVMDNQQQVRFREASGNGTNFIALQAPASVASDKTITLPDVTGTVVTTGDTGSVTSTMILDGTIVNADINASAAIAGTKVAPDFGSQTVQTTGIFSHALGTAGAPTVTFTGDTNTGIYSPGADQVAISTNGTGRLFVDASGNITVSTGEIFQTSATGYVRVSGGNAANTGATVIAFGQSHATSAGRLALAASGTGFFDISVGGNERLRITSTGLVGIGTQSPSYPLTIFNSTNNFLQFSKSGDAVAGVLIGRPNAISELRIQNSENEPITFLTNNTERMRLDSSGRLGLGTSSPDVGLHYRGDQPKLRIESSNELATTAGTEEIGRLEWEGFRNTNLNAAASIRARQDGTWSTTTAWISPTALEFYTQNNTGVEVTSPRLTINSSGNVGIGTTSPSTKLHVSDATQSIFRIEGSTGAGHLAANASSVYVTTESAIPFIFYTNQTERGRWDSSGRFLVGTSTARANFFNTTLTAGIQVEGTGGTTARGALSVVNNDSSNNPSLLILGRSGAATLGSNSVLSSGDWIGTLSFQGADGTELVEAANITAFVDGTPGANDMPGRLVFSTTADGASSPTERMRIDSAGRFGIPSINTAKTLTVNSSTTTDIASFENSNGSATGTCIAVATTRAAGTTAYFVYGQANSVATIAITNNGDVRNLNNVYAAISDIKLKENIVDANSQWDDIKALQVRNYNFKQGEAHKQIGLVAQEVEEVSPGLVIETVDRDADGNSLGTVTKSVNYSVLYMKAVKALQEAMERIEQLENSNADLLARVTALEAS